MSDAAETPSGRVSLAWDGPLDAPNVAVLAPGAGGGMESRFMCALAAGIASAGVRVCRFNFSYVEQGRRSPDRAPVLEDTYRAVVAHVQERHRGPLALGGKSMGGRIASQLVASGQQRADGLFFLGYPLHPPGRPDRMRDAHLYSIEVPMLFVEGTRDPFCPLETLAPVRARLRAENLLVVIEDGNHSLEVRKSSRRSTTQAWAEASNAVSGWLKTLQARQ